MKVGCFNRLRLCFNNLRCTFRLYLYNSRRIFFTRFLSAKNSYSLSLVIRFSKNYTSHDFTIALDSKFKNLYGLLFGAYPTNAHFIPRGYNLVILGSMFLLYAKHSHSKVTNIWCYSFPYLIWRNTYFL